MTSAWVVRAGRYGEREDDAILEGYAIAGWQELGDLSQVAGREDLRTLLARTYKNQRPSVLANWTGQLWRFIHEIREGDLVVIPLKTRDSRLAIGRVAGPYRYREDARSGFRHVRPVKWLRTDLPRDAVRFDLLHSMGSLLTVFGLKRHGAPGRIAHLAEHGVDPGRTLSEADSDTFATREELLDLAADSSVTDPPRLSIRALLDLWGAGRRTERVVAEIAADLTDRGLTTKPPFTEGWVHNMIQIVPVGGEPEPSAGGDVTTAGEVSPDEPAADLPPISLRVGDLKSASSGVASVSLSEPLEKAYTIMLTGDYSQLLVTDSDGSPRGALSWESIAKAHLAGKELTITNTMVNALIVEHDEDLLGRIGEIYDRGFLFVRGPDYKAVTGIITAADLTLEFGSMTRPFAIIEQIERRLRRRVGEVFTLDEIRAVAPNSTKIKSAADLMLGAYGRLLDNEASFASLGWPLDHNSFLEQLDAVRRARNELMHFSPDPLTQQQIGAIEGFLNMLRTVDPRP